MGIHPYGSRDACWGCGLTPNIRTGDSWHPYLLCEYCADLRTLILGERFGTDDTWREPSIGPVGPSGVSPLPVSIERTPPAGRPWRGGGIRVITTEIADGFVPPSASMDPAATITPGFTDMHYDSGLIGPA